MATKKVTMTVTFDMDESEESIKNFQEMKEGFESGELQEELEGEGWSNVTSSLVQE